MKKPSSPKSHKAPTALSPARITTIEATAAKLAEGGDAAGAAQQLLRAARAEPRNTARWAQIATWQRQSRAAKEAVETVRQALEMNGITVAESATPAKAKSTKAQGAKSQDAKPLAPLDKTETAALWQALAEAQWDARNWEGCIGACTRLLELQPRSLPVLEMQATALLQAGQPEQSMKVMQELLRLSPRDPLHRLRYATLLQLQGRSGDALREFQRVLLQYPDAPFVGEANEAVEALDSIQIQQILMIAGEEHDFRYSLQQEMETVLSANGFYLSENGRESLRNMLGDGRPDIEAAPTRIH